MYISSNLWHFVISAIGPPLSLHFTYITKQSSHNITHKVTLSNTFHLVCVCVNVLLIVPLLFPFSTNMSFVLTLKSTKQRLSFLLLRLLHRLPSLCFTHIIHIIMWVGSEFWNFTKSSSPYNYSLQFPNAYSLQFPNAQGSFNAHCVHRTSYFHPNPSRFGIGFTIQR